MEMSSTLCQVRWVRPTQVGVCAQSNGAGDRNLICGPSSSHLNKLLGSNPEARYWILESRLGRCGLRTLDPAFHSVVGRGHEFIP